MRGSTRCRARSRGRDASLMRSQAPPRTCRARTSDRPSGRHRLRHAWERPTKWLQHSRLGARTPARWAPATGTRPWTLMVRRPVGWFMASALQRTSRGKSKGTRGSFQPRALGPPQQDGRGRRSASAGAERDRDGLKPGGQSMLEADGTFAVYIRGSRVDLTRTAREKYYMKHILPQIQGPRAGEVPIQGQPLLGRGLPH